MYRVETGYQRSRDGRDWAVGHPPAATTQVMSKHGDLDGAVRAAVDLVGSPSPMGWYIDAYVMRGDRELLCLELDHRRDRTEVNSSRGTARTRAIASRVLRVRADD